MSGFMITYSFFTVKFYQKKGFPCFTDARLGEAKNNRVGKRGGRTFTEVLDDAAPCTAQELRGDPVPFWQRRERLASFPYALPANA